MSLYIPKWDILKFEELLPKMAGICAQQELASFKNGKIEIFPVLLDISFDSIIPRYPEQNDILGYGLLAIRVGYSIAQAWVKDDSMSFDELISEVSDKMKREIKACERGQNCYSKSKLKNDKWGKVVLVADNILTQHMIAKRHFYESEKDYKIQYLFELTEDKTFFLGKNATNTSSTQQKALCWTDESTQIFAFYKALYALGISFFIFESNIDAYKKLNDFYSRTHYRYDEQIRSRILDTVKQYCPDVPHFSFNEKAKEYFAENLLIDLKKFQEDNSNLSFNLPIEYMKWCYFAGLGFYLLEYDHQEYYEDESGGHILIEDHESKYKEIVETRGLFDMDEFVLETYDNYRYKRNMSTDELREQASAYTYAALTINGESDKDLKMGVLDLLDCGKALFYIGNYVGAYALNHLLKDVRF